MFQDYASQLVHENSPLFSIGLFTFEREFDGDNTPLTCGVLCLLDCGRDFDPLALERTGARLFYEYGGQTVYVISPIRHTQNIYLYPLQSHLLQTLQVSSVSKLGLEVKDDFLTKIHDPQHFLNYIHKTYALGPYRYSMSYPSSKADLDELFNPILNHALTNPKGINEQDLDLLDCVIHLAFDKDKLLKTTHIDKSGNPVYDCSNIFLNNLDIVGNRDITCDHLFYYYKKNKLSKFFGELDDYKNLYDSMGSILSEQEKLGIQEIDALCHFFLYAFILCGKPTSAYVNTFGQYPVLWSQCQRLYTSNYESLYPKMSPIYTEQPSEPVDFALGIVDDIVNPYSLKFKDEAFHMQASVFIINATNICPKIALIHHKTGRASDYEYRKLLPLLNFEFRILDFGDRELILAQSSDTPAVKTMRYHQNLSDEAIFEFFEILFLMQIKQHIQQQDKHETTPLFSTETVQDTDTDAQPPLSDVSVFADELATPDVSDTTGQSDEPKNLMGEKPKAKSDGGKAGEDEDGDKGGVKPELSNSDEQELSDADLDMDADLEKLSASSDTVADASDDGSDAENSTDSINVLLNMNTDDLFTSEDTSDDKKEKKSTVIEPESPF